MYNRYQGNSGRVERVPDAPQPSIRPHPPAPPRWQESEPKPERSSRENVQTSSSPQRIRSKISVLCARSKWLSRREEKSTIRR